jgi:hypothetical protein
MTSRSLDNLVKSGQLKAEAKAQSEFDGLIRSGMARLTDAIRNHSRSRVVSISFTTPHIRYH